ncbi:MAG: DNA-processing protein DprA [Burkholderiaceae bacterium]
MAREELAAWLRLVLTPGVGNESARKLLAAFGLPKDLFGQPLAALTTVVGERLARALQQAPESLDAEVDQTSRWLGLENHHLLTLGDAAYPPALLQMSDPPLTLYVVGALGALDHPNKIAIVGSRNPTPQGQINARQFASALGEAGLCVVSGLALGVDGAAHEAPSPPTQRPSRSLAPGWTGSIPSGIMIWPTALQAQGGAIISEYPLGTPPLPAHFPQRNRIIAGLSQGTLVVEAAVASGSLITARLASEMGREVFAIPGSIHAPQARGCHALIRQGAKLVESAQDVLEDLQLGVAAPSTSTQSTRSADDPEGLLNAMGFDPVGLDALQARTGLDTAALQARLLELELQGFVGRLPGGLLQQTAQS